MDSQWTVKKLKQVPACFLVHHGHTSFEHICAKCQALMISVSSDFSLSSMYTSVHFELQDIKKV